MTIWSNVDLAHRLNMGVAMYADGVDIAATEAAMRVGASRIVSMTADLRQVTDELSAMLGYMRNARIDLETGTTKATAIRTLSGGIKRGEIALKAARSAISRATGAADAE